MIKDILDQYANYVARCERGSRICSFGKELRQDQALCQIYAKLKKAVPSKKNNPEGLDRPIDYGYNQAIDTIHKNLKNVCGVK